MSLNTNTLPGKSLSSQTLKDLAAWYDVLQHQVERINQRVTRLENAAGLAGKDAA